MRSGPIRWLVVGGTLLIAAIAVGTTLMAREFPRTRAAQRRARARKHRAADGPSFRPAARRISRSSRRISSTTSAQPDRHRRGLSQAPRPARTSTGCCARRSSALPDVGGVNIIRRRRQSDQFVGRLAGPERQRRRSRLFQDFQITIRTSPDVLIEPVLQPHLRRLDHPDRAQGRRDRTANSWASSDAASSRPISRNSSPPSCSAKAPRSRCMHRDGTLLARYPACPAR